MDARPVASVGGAWHEHNGEVYPTCPVCLDENAVLKSEVHRHITLRGGHVGPHETCPECDAVAELKGSLAKAIELLEWSRSPDRYSESFRRITAFLDRERRRAQGER